MSGDSDLSVKTNADFSYCLWTQCLCKHMSPVSSEILLFSSSCCLNLLSKSRSIGVRSFLPKPSRKSRFWTMKGNFHLLIEVFSTCPARWRQRRKLVLISRMQSFWIQDSYLGGDQFINGNSITLVDDTCFALHCQVQNHSAHLSGPDTMTVAI